MHLYGHFGGIDRQSLYRRIALAGYNNDVQNH